MSKLTSGMLARSLAGHDKGKLYVVTAVDGDFVYLADGRIRTSLNPKRKKRMHVQPNYTIPELIRARQESGHAVQDEDIQSTLREYQLKVIKTKEV